MRIDKDFYYLNIAEQVSKRSTCLCKHWGAIIVKDDTIISTGFNGAPRKVKDCMERGYCRLQKYRKDNNLGRGTAYEQCLSVHAEQNAIIFADKEQMKDASLYLVGTEITDLDGTEQYVINPKPCAECRKLIINAGIKHVFCKISKDELVHYPIQDWINEDEITGIY